MFSDGLFCQIANSFQGKAGASFLAVVACIRGTIYLDTFAEKSFSNTTRTNPDFMSFFDVHIKDVSPGQFVLQVGLF